MRFSPMRRLPSVLVLVVFVGVALVVPLFTYARADLRTADARIAAADASAEQADGLQELMRLAPAVAAEQQATAAALAAAEAAADLPEGAMDAIGLDYGTVLTTARRTLDQTIADFGDAGVAPVIDEIRLDVDGGELSVTDALDRYADVSDRLAASIFERSALIQSSASETASADLAAASRIAETAVQLEIEAGEQLVMWMLLKVPVFARSVDDVRALDESLTRVDVFAATLDDLTAEDSPAGTRWQALRTSEPFEALFDTYATTVRDLTESGVPATAALPDYSTLDIAEILELADEANLAMARSADLFTAMVDVIDAALSDVSIAAAQAQSDAKAAKRTTLQSLGGFIVLMMVGFLALIGLIVRPVGRMADVAEALRRGELDARMPETGPKELRVAAHALNEAITALETAEAQAVALAEERLDDPILSQPGVGRLGASLQSAVTHLASSLTEREGFQRRLAHEAAHDGLTKLPNRNAVLVNLQSALARTRRSSTSLALLFLDLDDFKSINDLHGHQFGDSVLRTIATRLSAAIREGDLAGRLGGDEFVVVAEPVDGIEDAIVLSDRILDMVGAPITIGSTTIVPSVSIGIGIADDADLTADELLRDADLAVYRAKSLGKGRVDVCDEDLRNEMRERTSLEQAIQDAISNDELVVQFQPTVDTNTNEVSSLEALVRWERPGHGLVSPDDFIPVAERSDLIIQLDRWVLCTVAARLALWTDHPTLGSLPISVNVSARHLSSGSLADEVDRILSAHDVAPNRVILEVTETALLDDIVGAAKELASLRHTGVRIALDDFGTGYLSLAHLRGLPVDVIKIDRSFVSKIDSHAERSLIKLIVDTGHVLGATVTAEGVETNDQAQVLADFGSDYLQGYLFSRPVDPTNIETLMASGARPVQRTEYFEPDAGADQDRLSAVSDDRAASH